ncbi:hypothetical protein B586_16860 [Mycobacterium haemophilum DSM 44634]|nr:hypothetical protein B586_16860 [Mycobacterium haemophilum DSM 44634]
MAHIRGELATIPLSQALTNLDSSAQGLTAAQAETRLRRYEPNEIAERHRNPVLVFLGYFWAPIPWMIEAALVLSLAARHWTDALIIAVLLAMNSLVDFAEEHQAANAITALKQRLAASARVLRDGAWATVAARGTGARRCGAGQDRRRDTRRSAPRPDPHHDLPQAVRRGPPDHLRQ